MVWSFIGVYIINRTLHGCLEIRNVSSCVEKLLKYFPTREDKFCISKRPWNILYKWRKNTTWVTWLLLDINIWQDVSCLCYRSNLTSGYFWFILGVDSQFPLSPNPKRQRKLRVNLGWKNLTWNEIWPVIFTTEKTEIQLKF